MALSLLAPYAASAATVTASMAASVTTECSRFKGRDLAACELKKSNGRPIRRHVKEKALKLIKEHRKLTRDASRVKSTSSTSSAATE